MQKEDPLVTVSAYSLTVASVPYGLVSNYNIPPMNTLVAGFGPSSVRFAPGAPSDPFYNYNVHLWNMSGAASSPWPSNVSCGPASDYNILPSNASVANFRSFDHGYCPPANSLSASKSYHQINVQPMYAGSFGKHSGPASSYGNKELSAVTSSSIRNSRLADGRSSKTLEKLTKVKSTVGWWMKPENQEFLGRFARDLRVTFAIMHLLTSDSQLPFSDSKTDNLVEAKLAGLPAVIVESIKDPPVQGFDAIFADYTEGKDGTSMSIYDASGKGKEMRKEPAKKLLRRFRERHEAQASLAGCQKRALTVNTDVIPNDFTIPIKWLNGQGRNVQAIPRCISDSRYHVLEKVQRHLDNSPHLERHNKQTKTGRKPNTWIQGLNFVLISMEDSISPWHTDRHALHTVISPVVGEKLWIMLAFKNDTRGVKGRRRFEREGVNFDVQKAIDQDECDIWWTIISPDTSLVIFDSVPHMVYTLSDCLYTEEASWMVVT